MAHEQTARAFFPPSAALCQQFLSLLETHVSRLTIRGHKASGLCPFHPDRNPSFSADLEKCVWYCFPCGKGGGVKDFALLVGEGWNETPSQGSMLERKRVAVQVRRRQAEEQARVILVRRKDEREAALWAQYFMVNDAASEAAELLAFFHRRPDLAEEFSLLVTQTERECGNALFQRSIIEARLAGELW